MSRRRARGEARRLAGSGSRQPSRVPAVLPARWIGLLPLLVVGAGLLAYQDSFGGPFVFDDVVAITKNPTIRELSWGTIFPPRSAVRGRPVVNLSLGLNYAVGGLDPTSYHAINLAVHVMAGLVLFGVVRRTLELPALASRYGAGAPWVAACVALLWVVHPLLSESVLYIIQRTELLVGLFYLVTLYCLVRATTSGRPQGWYAGVVVAFVLGIGCKEVMLTAPVVLLAYDRLLLAPSLRTVLRRRGFVYASLGLLAAAYVSLVGLRIQQELPYLLSSATQVTQLDYARTQCGVIVHYLRLAFWPHPLSADYDDWPIAGSLADVLPSALVIAGLLGTTVWAALRELKAAFLGIWFFGILAPTSSILPINTEIVAERRMYLPLAAVITLVVLTADRVLRALLAEPRHAARRRSVAAVLVLAAAAILTACTVRRSADFRSTVDFWKAIIATRPENARAHLGLAGTLFKAGRTAEALEHYTATVRLRPDDAQGRYERGATLARLGRTAEAVEEYREALRLNPGQVQAHNDLAVVLAAEGRQEEAIDHYRAALEADPRHASAHYNLGVALFRLGRFDEAAQHLETALALVPDDPATLRVLNEVQRAREREAPGGGAAERLPGR